MKVEWMDHTLKRVELYFVLFCIILYYYDKCFTSSLSLSKHLVLVSTAFQFTPRPLTHCIHLYKTVTVGPVQELQELDSVGNKVLSTFIIITTCRARQSKSFFTFTLCGKRSWSWDDPWSDHFWEIIIPAVDERVVVKWVRVISVAVRGAMVLMVLWGL